MNKADYYICPGCGGEVRVGSRGCPKCNQLDPWEIEDNEIYDGVDLPDDEFDYKKFVANEFGGQVVNRKGFSLFWWIVAVILLIAMIFQLFLL